MSDREGMEEWGVGWTRPPRPPADEEWRLVWARVRPGAPDPAPDYAPHLRHADEQQKANDGRFWMGFSAGYVVALVLAGGLWWLAT